MKIVFLQIMKNHLIWAFLLLLASMRTAYCIFADKETVLAAISTGLVVIFGYFATHYLAISRDQKEKKFQLCLELIKKLRFFILEEHLKKEEAQQSKLRDELQDAYFAFSLLISATSYDSLVKMMGAFGEMLKEPSKLEEFKKAQSHFINSLRKEFFIDKEIQFETYDFRIGNKSSQ